MQSVVQFFLQCGVGCVAFLNVQMSSLSQKTYHFNQNIRTSFLKAPTPGSMARWKYRASVVDWNCETYFGCGSTLSNLPGEGDGLLPRQKLHPAGVTRQSGQQTDSCHQSLAPPDRCRLTARGTLARMAIRTQFTGYVFLPASLWCNAVCH